MGIDLWAVLIIVGPILLGLTLLWVRLHNRVSRRQAAETERATRRLYDEEGRRDAARDDT